MNKSLKIIKKLNLDNYLNSLIKYNVGNNNPYHNFYHTMTVVKNIYYIGKSIDMDWDKLRLLVIAGIFHDFNHSAGKLKDPENISNAIDAFYQFTEETEEDSEFVSDMIKITQFPYNKEDVLNEYHKVIRDADIMQFLEKNYIQQVLFGLGNEISGSNELTVVQLENQIKFMETIEIFNDYTKHKMKKKIQDKIEDITYLIRVLKNN